MTTTTLHYPLGVGIVCTQLLCRTSYRNVLCIFASVHSSSVELYTEPVLPTPTIFVRTHFFFRTVYSLGWSIGVDIVCTQLLV